MRFLQRTVLVLMPVLCAEASVPVLAGATITPLGGAEYEASVIMQNPGGSYLSIKQVHVFLANSGPAEGFDCHMIAQPDGVLYLGL